jgi:hypothetical protein
VKARAQSSVLFSMRARQTMGKTLGSVGLLHVVCWRSVVQDTTAKRFALDFYASLKDQGQARDYELVTFAFQQAVVRMSGGGGKLGNAPRSTLIRKRWTTCACSSVLDQVLGLGAPSSRENHPTTGSRHKTLATTPPSDDPPATNLRSSRRLTEGAPAATRQSQVHLLHVCYICTGMRCLLHAKKFSSEFFNALSYMYCSHI